ncbi:MAG: glycosyltransferase [Ignavibacteria bacterium]|nr:glycosyltransferase [Ignavibacteria bacterium]
MNYLLNENFDNLQGWKLYKSAVSPDYKNSSNYSLKFITNGSYAITPLLTTPQNIQLHYKLSTHQTWGTDKWGNPSFNPVDQLFLYYSKDLVVWTKINCGGPDGGIFPSKDIPEHEIKYFYKSNKVNISLYENIYLKLERVNKNGGKVSEDFYIDDIIIENKIKSFKTNVVISAYDAAEFIEECLDSIKSQTHPVNKILLGIDGCPKTLEKVKNISWKYDNLEIYNAEKKNKGKYVTINSLIDLVPNDEYFITFDADDVMNPDMVSKMTIDTQPKVCDDGVIFISKEIFNKVGGYQDWKCAADSDLLKRLSNVTKINRIERLYFRREHEKQLTKMPETKHGSELRRTYTKIMNENKNIKIEAKKNEIKKIEEMDELDVKILGMLEDMEKRELKDKIERLEERINIIDNRLKYIETNKSTEDKLPLSIIITAYQTENYIEECLDSIENQTYFNNNNNYEILIGVDNCAKTLKKLEEIKSKYRNIKIYMMDSNKGTYITSNTLLNLVKYDNILRFDSDDIMDLDMIKEVMYFAKYYDVIRIKCVDFFIKDNKKIYTLFKRFAAGVIFYKKPIIELVGAYEPWICAADSDLIERINKISTSYFLDKVLFYRRVHQNSLSTRDETKNNSQIRNMYHSKMIENKNNNIINVERITNSFKEIIKIKHLVVTRLAIKWRFNETNLSWDDWLKNSIYLMNRYCRPSLKNQSNQDFTLLSIVDKSVTYYGDVLENEIILKVPEIKKGIDIKKVIINSINKYIYTLKGYDYVIITRLDRDDCLAHDFVDNIRNNFSYIEEYIDINYSYIYDTKTDIFYKSEKYKKMISPFVSTYEKINNGKINCYPFLVDHTKVGKMLNGKKCDKLQCIQVIHDYNLKNKVYGIITDINKKDFGI